MISAGSPVVLRGKRHSIALGELAPGQIIATASGETENLKPIRTKNFKRLMKISKTFIRESMAVTRLLKMR